MSKTSTITVVIRFCMMVIILLITVGLSSSSSVSHDYQWLSYKQKYEKNYADKNEDSMRKSLFIDSLKFIESKKDESRKLAKKSTVGLNEFADWTEFEKSKLTGPYVKFHNDNKDRKFVSKSRSDDALGYFSNRRTFPQSLDLREAIPKRVTEVKKQGVCGSCWAFSTVSILTVYSLYSYQKIINNKISFSQHIQLDWFDRRFHAIIQYVYS